MNRNVYIGLKGGMASAALLLQFVLISSVGLELTGLINKYYLIGLSLSICVFPGLESSLVRLLPVEKENNKQLYVNNTYLLVTSLKYSYIISFFCSLLFIICTFLGIDVFLSSLLLPVSLAFYLFNCRVFPLILRLENKMLPSVISEPGSFSIVLVIFIIVFDNWLGVTNILVLLAFSLVVTNSLQVTILTSLFKTLEVSDAISAVKIRDLYKAVKSKYSFTFAMVSISNYMILWGLATLGSLVLQPEEVARSVTVFRVVGALLFLEGAVVAYYLPNLVASLTVRVKSSLYVQYKKYNTFSTLAFGVALLVLVLLLKVFELSSVDFALLIIIFIIQIVNTMFGSPFALALTVVPEFRVRIMAYTLILLAGAGYLVFYIFPSWPLLVLAFGFLQMVRFLMGLHSFSKYMRDT